MGASDIIEMVCTTSGKRGVVYKGYAYTFQTEGKNMWVWRCAHSPQCTGTLTSDRMYNALTVTQHFHGPDVGGSAHHVLRAGASVDRPKVWEPTGAPFPFSGPTVTVSKITATKATGTNDDAGRPTTKPTTPVVEKQLLRELLQKQQQQQQQQQRKRKMAAPQAYRLQKRPLDKWSTRERLALASSVKRSGDQNWVSVSRAIKPFADGSRPPDWFSQKNCALQYADLLEKAETPKRKRGEKGAEREVVETPANQIVRKLTIERIEELKEKVREEEQRFRKLKSDMERIQSGECDDNLAEIWAKMQADKQAAEEKRLEEERKLAEETAERSKLQAFKVTPVHQRSSVSSVSEVDESTQDSMPEQLNVETTDDEMPVTPMRPISIDIPPPQTGTDSKPPPPTSPLLSSLLQSKQISVDSLQQIKAEAEAEHALKQTQAVSQLDVATVEVVSEQVEPTVSMVETGDAAISVPVLNTPVPEPIKIDDIPEVPMVPEVKSEVDVETTETVIEVDTSIVKQEIIQCDNIVVEDTVEVTTHESPIKTAHESPIKTPQVKIEIVYPSVEEVVPEVPAPSSSISTDDKGSVRDEPPSPASSISSRVSETGSKSSSRKAKAGRTSTGSRRGSVRVTRRSTTGDELSSRASDGETSDDDGDSGVMNLHQSGMSAFSESIPNSPHSHCSDTEDDKAYRTWKKSIMWVWRAAANHKYANVFLHSVTDDIAPGYSSVVRRPKDLTVIKRHIENGTIRTTSEFQRDMMLMFTNAIMYNSSDHDVYKMAEEMYNDVMVHIEQYVSTQIMVQNTETKLLRPTRRNESSDKEEEVKRRRTSSEAEGGKTKKRKARGEET